MFPSKTPFLFVLHILAITIAVLAAIIGGLMTGQPLAILAIMAFQYLPNFPVLDERDSDDQDDEQLYARSKMGFGPAPKD